MKLIILDRDGVINQESRDYIKTPEEWKPIPGSLEAIARLTKAGYNIAIATNQSGVGRKMLSLQDLNDIHAKMIKLIEEHGGKIDIVCFCPHLPDAKCECRKPARGMFDQIAACYNVKLENTDPIFVGDSMCDVELGLSTGCKFFLTEGFGSDGRDTEQHLTDAQKQQITMIKDLSEIADRLLQ